jgi:hypothetical protein
MNSRRVVVTKLNAYLIPSKYRSNVHRIIIVFVIGMLIALEHTLRIDKAAIALLTGTIC